MRGAGLWGGGAYFQDEPGLSPLRLQCRPQLGPAHLLPAVPGRVPPLPGHVRAVSMVPSPQIRKDDGKEGNLGPQFFPRSHNEVVTYRCAYIAVHL